MGSLQRSGAYRRRSNSFSLVISFFHCHENLPREVIFDEVLIFTAPLEVYKDLAHVDDEFLVLL